MCSSSVSPHSLTIAAGFHDDRVGDREEEKQDGLGERGHVEIRYQREGSRYTRQQGVGHVGTYCGDRSVVGGEVHGAADVGAKGPPRDAGHLRRSADHRGFERTQCKKKKKLLVRMKDYRLIFKLKYLD